jgi:hypothetical protein
MRYIAKTPVHEIPGAVIKCGDSGVKIVFRWSGESSGEAGLA